MKRRIRQPETSRQYRLLVITNMANSFCRDVLSGIHTYLREHPGHTLRVCGPEPGQLQVTARWKPDAIITHGLSSAVREPDTDTAAESSAKARTPSHC